MVEGVARNNILRDIRKTADASNFSRMKLFERRGFLNVKKEFKLEYYFKLHNDDATSVEKFVENNKTYGEMGENNSSNFL